MRSLALRLPPTRLLIADTRRRGVSPAFNVIAVPGRVGATLSLAHPAASPRVSPLACLPR